MKVKTQTDKLKRKGVVYRIPSKHCNKVYIGETELYIWDTSLLLWEFIMGEIIYIYRLYT